MHSIAPSDYQDLVSVRDPQISPDRSRVAFVRQDPDGDRAYESTIYTVSVDGSTEPEQFTIAHGMDSQPRWSPSGDRLAFVSLRGDADRPQLWVASTDGGEARRITDVPGGVAAITWSPDGERIAFLQEVKPFELDAGHDTGRGEDYADPEPDPRMIDRLKYRVEGSYRVSRGREQYFDGARTHVYVVTPATGTVERVTDADLDADHHAPEWGDADTLYYLGQYEGDDDGIDFDVVAYELRTGESERLVRTRNNLNTSPVLSATTDGRVAYHADPVVDRLMPQTEIEVFDRETGETTTLTENLDRKPYNYLPLRWDDEGEDLLFMTHDEGTMPLWRVPGDGSGAPERVLAINHAFGLSVSGEHIAVVESEWDHPGDVFVADLDGGDRWRLTEVNADYLADREVQEPEELWYDNGEGDEIQGWVLTPPDFDPDETYPMVVQVHGGPSPVMWTTSGTVWHEFQTMAHHGYIVFWSNPRGSTGYGEEFQRATARDWGGPYYRDAMAGVDLLVERDYIDDDELYLTGGSYGGYMTGWAVTQTDRFAAATPQRGVYDLKTMYGTTNFPGLLEWYYGTLPWEEPELLWDHSPVAHAHDVDTPTLIFQAEHDYNCPRADSEMFHRYMKKNDVETRLLIYPREGHELSRSGEPAHVVDRLERILRWFDGYSDYFDVPPALERPPQAGLSTGSDILSTD